MVARVCVSWLTVAMLMMWSTSVVDSDKLSVKAKQGYRLVCGCRGWQLHRSREFACLAAGARFEWEVRFYTVACHVRFRHDFFIQARFRISRILMLVRGDFNCFSEWFPIIFQFYSPRNWFCLLKSLQRRGERFFGHNFSESVGKCLKVAVISPRSGTSRTDSSPSDQACRVPALFFYQLFPCTSSYLVPALFLSCTDLCFAGSLPGVRLGSILASADMHLGDQESYFRKDSSRSGWSSLV